jgi:hypothetical protein
MTPPHEIPITVFLTPDEIAKVDAIRRLSPVRWGGIVKTRADAVRLMFHFGADRVLQRERRTPPQDGGAV